jgi:hypothetical protein
MTFPSFPWSNPIYISRDYLDKIMLNKYEITIVYGKNYKNVEEKVSVETIITLTHSKNSSATLDCENLTANF